MRINKNKNRNKIPGYRRYRIVQSNLYNDSLWQNFFISCILKFCSTWERRNKKNIERTLQTDVNGGNDVDQLSEGVVQLFVIQIRVKCHAFRVVLLWFYHFQRRFVNLFQQSYEIRYKLIDNSERKIWYGRNGTETFTQQHLREELECVCHVEAGRYRLTSVEKSLIVIVEAGQF